MTKTQLIEKIAKENGWTKKQVAETVDATLAAVEGTLISGEAVQIFGFGTFAVKEVAAHTGRNPSTGEAVEIAASRKLTFSASKAIKDKLNES